MRTERGHCSACGRRTASRDGEAADGRPQYRCLDGRCGRTWTHGLAGETWDTKPTSPAQTVGLVAAVATRSKSNVAAYFEMLGFGVELDADLRSAPHAWWFNIYDGGELMIQVDQHAPLDEVLTELPRMAALDEGDNSDPKHEATWAVRGPVSKLRRVVNRMGAEVAT